MLDRRAFLSGIAGHCCRNGVHEHRPMTSLSAPRTSPSNCPGRAVRTACWSDPAELRVDRRFYLAGTYICQQAILAGRIDVYPEYTGTALAAVLKQTAAGDAAQVYEEVKREYLQKFRPGRDAASGIQQ